MFHFTIRDLLWLMVVVAVACGWLVDRNAFTIYDRRALVEAVNDAGYHIDRDGNGFKLFPYYPKR